MVLNVLFFLLAIAIAVFAYIDGKTKGITSVRSELLPKLQEREEINQHIKEQNEQIKEELQDNRRELSDLMARKETLVSSIEDLHKQADDSAKLYKEKTLEVAQLEIETALNKLAENYHEAEEAFRSEYMVTLEEAATILQQNLAANGVKLAEIEENINQLKATRDALIQANLREEERTNNLNFHKLVVSEADLADIIKLNALKPTLHKPEILSKLIWTTYFLQAANTLVNNIIGPNKTCGIYKITNINDNKVYIGQSVDCGDRVKQHIKAGLGIDNSGTNKLYRAMQAEGVWNFAFELLEACPRDQLDQKEKDFIEIYQSDTYGYNSTKGNG